jgi:hypothetical protein
VRGRARDIDLDGDTDLVLSFIMCDLVADMALGPSSTELVLTGATLSGDVFTGADSVKVVPD